MDETPVRLGLAPALLFHANGAVTFLAVGDCAAPEDLAAVHAAPA